MKKEDPIALAHRCLGAKGTMSIFAWTPMQILAREVLAAQARERKLSDAEASSSLPKKTKRPPDMTTLETLNWAEELPESDLLLAWLDKGRINILLDVRDVLDCREHDIRTAVDKAVEAQLKRI